MERILPRLCSKSWKWHLFVRWWMYEDFVSMKWLICLSVDFSQSFLKKWLSHHTWIKQMESLSPEPTFKQCYEYGKFITQENCLAFQKKKKKNKNKPPKSPTSEINSSTRLWWWELEGSCSSSLYCSPERWILNSAICSAAGFVESSITVSISLLIWICRERIKNVNV